MMRRSQTNNFAKELFIALAENVRRQRRENVGRFGIIDALEYVAQQLVIHFEAERQFIWRFPPTLLEFEMEEAGVVAFVGLLEHLAETPVDALRVRQRAQPTVIFDTSAFPDAQKDNSIDNPLAVKLHV